MKRIGLIGRVILGAALLFAACLCLPIGAHAGDWTVTSGIGETVGANSNPQLEPKSSGGDVVSITSLSLQAIDETPRVHWETDASLGFGGSWGPGAVSSLQGVSGAGTTAIATSTELTNYSASFSLSGLPASLTEIFDSGITDPNTKTISYSGAGSLQHQLNGLNAISLSVSGASEFFMGDNGSPETQNNLTPFTYLTTGQSWSHAVTPLTSIGLGANTAWYGTGDVARTDSLSESVSEQVSQSLTAQVQTQLSEYLAFAGGGGGDVVWTNASSNSTSTGNSITTGFIANAALSYSPNENTALSVFASHNLVPSSLGELQEATSAGFTVGHKINQLSSMGLTGFFQYQWPTTSNLVDFNQTQTQALGFSLGYQRNWSQYSASILVDSNNTQGQVLNFNNGGQTIFSLGYQQGLGQYWDMSLVYSFTEQDNDAGFPQSFNDRGSSTSNAVFLTIRRTFNFGKSGAIASPASPGLFGSPASPPGVAPPGLFGSAASPGLFGSPASPGLFGSPASPGLFGSPASPGLFGSPASPPGVFGSPASSPGWSKSTPSPEPGGGSS